jgi:hypothetical protein
VGAGGANALQARDKMAVAEDAGRLGVVATAVTGVATLR